MKLKQYLYLFFFLTGGVYVFVPSFAQDQSIKIFYADAQLFNDELFINWSTEYERHKTEFIIESSEDGETWKIFDREKSKGSEQTNTSYHFKAPAAKAHPYFRLRYLNDKGKIIYEDPFELEDYRVGIFIHEAVINNKKRLIIHYSIDQQQEIVLRLYNSLGEQVQTKLMRNSSPGDYLFHLDVGNVPHGKYMIEITQVLSNKKVAEKQIELCKHATHLGISTEEHSPISSKRSDS